MKEIPSTHDYFLPNKEIFANQDSWFMSNGIPIVRAFRLASENPERMPDIRTYRKLMLYELSIAVHPEQFHSEYGSDNPKPTELDRKAMLGYLKFHASFTGLLHLDEIRAIEEGSFEEFLRFTTMPENDKQTLPDRDELKKNIMSWKEEGCKIVAFQGSFDPPTETHLINATDAMLFAQDHDMKFKIIVILDGDELIQRKSTDETARPRVEINLRRLMLSPFWQVAGTCVSAVNDTKDNEGYANEYRELGIDYALITRKNNPTHNDYVELHNRHESARRAGINMLLLDELPHGLSSTELMERYFKTK